MLASERLRAPSKSWGFCHSDGHLASRHLGLPFGHVDDRGTAMGFCWFRLNCGSLVRQPHGVGLTSLLTHGTWERYFPRTCSCWLVVGVVPLALGTPGAFSRCRGHRGRPDGRHEELPLARSVDRSVALACAFRGADPALDDAGPRSVASLARISCPCRRARLMIRRAATRMVVCGGSALSPRRALPSSTWTMTTGPGPAVDRTISLVSAALHASAPLVPALALVGNASRRVSCHPPLMAFPMSRPTFVRLLCPRW